MTSASTERRSRIGSMELLPVVLIVFAVSGGVVSAYIASRPNLAVAATVVCGVFVQALPFLVLGVVRPWRRRCRRSGYGRATPRARGFE